MAKQDVRPTIPQPTPKYLVSLLRNSWQVKPENRPDMAQLTQMITALENVRKM